MCIRDRWGTIQPALSHEAEYIPVTFGGEHFADRFQFWGDPVHIFMGIDVLVPQGGRGHLPVIRTQFGEIAADIAPPCRGYEDEVIGARKLFKVGQLDDAKPIDFPCIEGVQQAGDSHIRPMGVDLSHHSQGCTAATVNNDATLGGEFVQGIEMFWCYPLSVRSSTDRSSSVFRLFCLPHVLCVDTLSLIHI
eukprot:TRINITY_DN25960_c0_g2_i1.p2 TRINITY_DN25960_c0_g2~~TRINITY_DN25960_c0_g2_i1.p2  ORF type:complete len:192 (+),score=27.75 TRINITY_DN25960_c0_g2_i1:160-735(+)